MRVNLVVAPGPARGQHREQMHDAIVIGAVLSTALAVSLAFWLLAMPRLSAPGVSNAARLWSVAAFGVMLIAVPIGGLILLAERNVVTVCGLIVGWAVAVRATAWFAARKCLVPRLRAMRGQEAVANDSPPPATQPSSGKPSNASPG